MTGIRNDRINLAKHIHKSTRFKSNNHTMSKSYKIIIHHSKNSIGLGDALEHIMIQYTDSSLFGMLGDTSNTDYHGDSRPQTIIANHSNHNNIVPFVNDEFVGVSDMDECRDGYILRRNINLQRLHRKHTFWAICWKIREDLVISLFTGLATLSICINTDENRRENLFTMFPSEILCIIVNKLDHIKLFDNLI